LQLSSSIALTTTKLHHINNIEIDSKNHQALRIVDGRDFVTFELRGVAIGVVGWEGVTMHKSRPQIATPEIPGDGGHVTGHGVQNGRISEHPGF
jgi:hypothetical protein